MRHSTRRGFTLVELLVVIAIIGMLIALLLPAVQAAREAGRRATCASQMRQLALAAHEYHDSYGRLPASGIVGPITGNVFNEQSGPQLSWIVAILPYIEQNGLYQQFNLSTSVLSQTGNPQAFPISTLHCPSDGSPKLPFQYGGKSFAKGNYAAWCSPFHVENQHVYPGALVGPDAHPFAKIEDGQSNTVFLSEVRASIDQTDHRGAWALPWAGSTLIALDLHSSNSSRFQTNPSYPVASTQMPNSGIGDTVFAPGCSNASAARVEGMPCLQTASYRSAAPRSRHMDGVNMAFVDGHLSYFRNIGSHITLAKLISINDGETPGEY